MMNKYFINKYKKGFSLIETMVAIAILLIAIVGPMTLASNSLVASAIAKDQFIASFLAQEGVELVRYQRDTGVLEGDSDWLDNLKPWCSNPGNDCRMDFITKTPANCSAPGCIPLNYNSTTKQYAYETGPGWAPSTFIRTIVVDDVTYDEEEEVEVISTIKWVVKGVERETTVVSHLYNWSCLFSPGGC